MRVLCIFGIYSVSAIGVCSGCIRYLFGVYNGLYVRYRFGIHWEVFGIYNRCMFGVGSFLFFESNTDYIRYLFCIQNAYVRYIFGIYLVFPTGHVRYI